MDDLKQCLEPFTELIKQAKVGNSPSLRDSVESLKSKLIEFNICNIRDNQFILDKIFDEILED
jgi:hypothetical protein